MRRSLLLPLAFVAAILPVTALVVASVPAGRSLVIARNEAARAGKRAAELDRQANAATRASERATIAAAAMAARVEETAAELASAQAALARLRRDRRALNARLAEQRAPIARLMAGLQSQVRRPALLALARPGSVREAVHLRAVLAAVQPQIGARTASLQAAAARARRLENEAVLAANRVRGLQARLEERRGALVAAAAAERLKASRAATAADREAERAFAIGAQARSLSGLVRQIAAEKPGARPVQAGARRQNAVLSDYRLPVSGAVIEQSGSRDLDVALLARPAAVVVAPAAGRVAFAGPYRGYGAVVIIEHPAGWTSLVTGLARVDTAVGQAVIAGSPLGTAPQHAPRIGLELRRNGERVNPLDQLR